METREPIREIASIHMQNLKVRDHMTRRDCNYSNPMIQEREYLSESLERMRNEQRPLQQLHNNRNFNSDDAVSRHSSEETVRDQSMEMKMEEKRKQQLLERSMEWEQLLEERSRERQQSLRRSMERYRSEKQIGQKSLLDNQHRAQQEDRVHAMGDTVGHSHHLIDGVNNHKFAASRIMAEDIVRPLERVDGNEYLNTDHQIDVRSV